jgi:hypothetical protein
MEGGSVEQRWSGEEEAAFIADVLQTVDIKNRHCKRKSQAVYIREPPV